MAKPLFQSVSSPRSLRRSQGVGGLDMKWMEPKEGNGQYARIVGLAFGLAMDMTRSPEVAQNLIFEPQDILHNHSLAELLRQGQSWRWLQKTLHDLNEERLHQLEKRRKQEAIEKLVQPQKNSA